VKRRREAALPTSGPFSNPITKWAKVSSVVECYQVNIHCKSWVGWRTVSKLCTEPIILSFGCKFEWSRIHVIYQFCLWFKHADGLYKKEINILWGVTFSQLWILRLIYWYTFALNTVTTDLRLFFIVKCPKCSHMYLFHFLFFYLPWIRLKAVPTSQPPLKVSFYAVRHFVCSKKKVW
jgi:hypothetical protein